MQVRVNIWMRGSTLYAVAILVLFATPDVAGMRPSAFLDTEGLYYFDAGTRILPDMSFVITRDGGAIEPKSNDPEAPTQPGFYFGGTRYSFKTYRVTTRSISFQTAIVDGVSYSFSGRVGHENVGSIKRVPFVTGTLITKQAGTATRARERFVKAVVL